MDATDLLFEFAKAQNIDEKEVKNFLKKFEHPQTLEELFEVPDSMLNHATYFSYLKEPLKSFIDGEISKSRYETIDLDQVVDALGDYRLELEEDDEEGKTYADSVEKALIETKFGSVVYDW